MQMANAVLSAPGWNRKVTIDGNAGGASGPDLEEQESCAKDGMSLLGQKWLPFVLLIGIGGRTFLSQGAVTNLPYFWDVLALYGAGFGAPSLRLSSCISEADFQSNALHLNSP